MIFIVLIVKMKVRKVMKVMKVKELLIQKKRMPKKGKDTQSVVCNTKEWKKMKAKKI